MSTGKNDQATMSNLARRLVEEKPGVPLDALVEEMERQTGIGISPDFVTREMEQNDNVLVRANRDSITFWPVENPPKGYNGG